MSEPSFDALFVRLAEAAHLVPLTCFVIAPEWTPRAIARARAWINRHSKAFAIYGLAGIGVALVGKGIVGLL